MKKEREFVLIDKKIAEMIFISLDRYRPHNHVGYKDVVKAEITENELKLLIASLKVDKDLLKFSKGVLDFMDGMYKLKNKLKKGLK